MEVLDERIGKRTTTWVLRLVVVAIVVSLSRSIASNLAPLVPIFARSSFSLATLAIVGDMVQAAAILMLAFSDKATTDVLRVLWTAWKLHDNSINRLEEAVSVSVEEDANR